MSKYITQCALSIKGTRIEKGQEIELDEDYAKGLGGDLVKAGEVAETEAPEKAEEKSIDELTLSELKAKAESLGLSTKGSKADLIERINLANSSDGEYVQ